MHMRLIKFLLKLRAPRIIYVSCNPATWARDLDYLCHGVDVKDEVLIDCMEVHKHPSLRLPLLKNRNLEMKKPATSFPGEQETEKSHVGGTLPAAWSEPDYGGCPTGTVPIIRTKNMEAQLAAAAAAVADDWIG
ncbi:hypothetical protein SAY87_005665 [Trapa incisa]|uniref:Neprosin activation peptide domain-containing protein n=1 Tax=Trapa incisa TaxID=236973 RepID=A0AAN7Q7C7_9MYRT|nr:hypothetical protein SAY87_005665 [Trapa incisa]